MKPVKKIYLIAALMAPNPAHALYKCTVEGVVKYQAAPCPDNPDGAPITLKLPPQELQDKMRRQQLERNAEIAKQTKEELDHQREIDKQNYWRTQEQLSIDRENDYRQRMQQIQDQANQDRLDIKCNSHLPDAKSEECKQWRYDKRWEN